MPNLCHGYMSMLGPKGLKWSVMMCHQFGDCDLGTSNEMFWFPSNMTTCSWQIPPTSPGRLEAELTTAIMTTQAFPETDLLFLNEAKAEIWENSLLLLGNRLTCEVDPVWANFLLMVAMRVADKKIPAECYSERKSKWQDVERNIRFVFMVDQWHSQTGFSMWQIDRGITEVRKCSG